MKTRSPESQDRSSRKGDSFPIATKLETSLTRPNSSQQFRNRPGAEGPNNNNRNGNSRRVVKVLPIYIPPEEFIFIKKDFFQQISLLLHIMKKVDSRGFLFRLDFNGFLSSATI